MGGHSLLALRLLHDLQQHFQPELPLSALFQFPTIAQLATLLDSPPAQSPVLPESLVPLQPSGSLPPFFCVHPIFGVVFPYLELAHHLGPEQAFYGLQPIGLTGHPPCATIPEMATHYRQAIQTVQPQGPYYLGGWSFGGLVAFEMAQRLQAAGQTVALLALLDTPAPLPKARSRLRNGLRFLLTTVLQSGLPFLLDYLALLTVPQALPGNSRFNLPQVWQRSLLQRQWSALAHLLPEDARLRLLDERMMLPMLRVFYANSRAVERLPAPSLS